MGYYSMVGNVGDDGVLTPRAGQPATQPDAADNLTEEVALTAVKQADAGLVVRGSRLLAALP